MKIFFLNFIFNYVLLGTFISRAQILIIHTPLIGYFVACGKEAAKRFCVWHQELSTSMHLPNQAADGKTAQGGAGRLPKNSKIKLRSLMNV
jgi:hypothetical protein